MSLVLFKGGKDRTSECLGDDCEERPLLSVFRGARAMAVAITYFGHVGDSATVVHKSQRDIARPIDCNNHGTWKTTRRAVFS